MDDFLTFLYFKKFKISEEHVRLRELRDFPNEYEAHRNDQRITDILQREMDIDTIITQYMEQKGN